MAIHFHYHINEAEEAIGLGEKPTSRMHAMQADFFVSSFELLRVYSFK